MRPIREFMVKVFGYGYENYRDIIFGLLFGMFVAWMYHKFIGNKNLKSSYERLLKSKDETINALKEVIDARLSDIRVDNKHESFFARVRQYFKTINELKNAKK